MLPRLEDGAESGVEVWASFYVATKKTPAQGAGQHLRHTMLGQGPLNLLAPLDVLGQGRLVFTFLLCILYSGVGCFF